MIITDNVQTEEKNEPEAYGFACRQSARQIVDYHFPQMWVASFFDRDQFKPSLEELAKRIAQQFPVSIFQSKSLHAKYDLLTRLTAISSDPYASNCRVSVYLMGVILERDNLGDEIALANVAFDENNLQHGQLLTISNGNMYVTHFAAVDYFKVELWDNSRFPYPQYPFTDQGIYDFEYGVGNVP